jgi:hypothetical protein
MNLILNWFCLHLPNLWSDYLPIHRVSPLSGNAVRCALPYFTLSNARPFYWSKAECCHCNCIIARIKFILSCLVFVDSLSNFILYQVYNDFRSRMRWLVSLSAILVQLYRLYMFVEVLNGGNKHLIMRVMKGWGLHPIS